MGSIKFYSVTDEYGEFSNFASYEITLDKERWKTVEHYFQAQKFADKSYQQKIKKANTPSLAAKLGRDHKQKLRTDWESVKVSVMKRALVAKFTQHQSLVQTFLNRKPGALRNGEPFLNWKLPEPIKQLQHYLLSKPKGDKAMVELLNLIAEYGEDVGITAASIALEEGVPTVEAVLNIINRLLEPNIPTLKAKEIPLNTPPQSNCQRYNSLLKGTSYASS